MLKRKNRKKIGEIIEKNREEMRRIAGIISENEQEKMGGRVREICNDVKKMKKICRNGKIYKIWDEGTGKTYIGSTLVSMETRFLWHMIGKRKRKSIIYEYFEKKGWKKAEYEVIEKYFCNNLKELVEREAEHYDKIKISKLLNQVRPGGGNGKKKKKRKKNMKRKKKKLSPKDKIKKKEKKEKNKLLPKEEIKKNYKKIKKMKKVDEYMLKMVIEYWKNTKNKKKLKKILKICNKKDDKLFDKITEDDEENDEKVFKKIVELNKIISFIEKKIGEDE